MASSTSWARRRPFRTPRRWLTSSTLHLEKFLPTRFGLVVPVSITGSWGWVNPQLISQTDVQASGLVGLRRPRNDATTWQISVSDPLRQHEARITRWLLNPLSFSATGSAGTNITSLSQATASTWSTSLSYFLNNQRRAYGMHLGALTRGLPRWLRESTAGRGLANASFAPLPTPGTVHLGGVAHHGRPAVVPATDPRARRHDPQTGDLRTVSLA